MHLRGRENVLKRLVVHAGAANLGLLMRKLFGAGTPKSLQGRLAGAFSVVIRGKSAVRGIWPSGIIHFGRLVHRWSIPTTTCSLLVAA